MRKLDPHTLLSALWLFILLNIIFRDIHQFALKSHLEMLLTGYYDGMLITDELMLLGGFLALVPISMVVLSLLLQPRWLRPATAVAVVFTAGPRDPRTADRPRRRAALLGRIPCDGCNLVDRVAIAAILLLPDATDTSPTSSKETC